MKRADQFRLSENRMKNQKLFEKIIITIKITLIIITTLCFSCIFNPEPEPPNLVSVSVLIRGKGNVQGIKDTLIQKGGEIKLTATADSNYFFAGWSPITEKFQNPLTLIVNQAIVITAYFVKNPEDMILVNSRGKTFQMGTDSLSLPNYERPQHSVYFDYNYYLASKEVTIGDYRSLFPSFSSTMEDGVPAGNITWYDAILYCNALSKSKGYDTVYTYKSACFDNRDCPFILEDWNIHYDRAGYRLPTEAEWEYACKANTTTELWWGNDPADTFAWYTINSSGISHPAGTKKPNPWGFYDMTGNVAEWVNDWFDYYDIAIDTNPVGPTHLLSEVFETSWQRPIRGGSYRLGINFLRSNSRKGPYETGAFFAQEDIGFRVAFGVFRAKNYSRNDNDSTKDSIAITVDATKTDLINFIGTSSVKCAFVITNQLIRKLYIIDYASAGTPVYRCGNDQSVYNPVISPDGKFVAYSSMSEGYGGICTLTVRPTTSDTTSVNVMKMPGIVPRWWVSPDGVDTFLIYSTGASMNSQPRWHTEKTMKVRMSNGKAAAASEVLWADGSYHGGLSADGRFLATGYTVARLVDLQINDTNIFYFWPPQSGRDDITQLCNVSMSPSLSEPGEVMLLDFGYPKVSTVTGSSYGFHEVIFVCNTKLMTNEHVSKWFKVPSQFSQWDYPEWSNHPDFASALACSYEKDVIHVIDCKKGTYQPLISGQNVREMHLWIDPVKLPIVSDPYQDFGRYDLPVQCGGQITLSKKLHTFWRYHDEWEIAIVGSSTAYYGFDPSVMSRKAINFGCHASTIATASAVAEYYCLPHASKLKAIVVDLTSYSFNVDSYKNAPRLTGLLDSKGFELDSSHNFYRGGIPSELVTKINSWGPQQWQGFDSLGFHLEQKDTGWGRPIIDKGDYDFDDPVVQSNIAILKNMSNLAALSNVHVLVVNIPQHPGYATSENMGRLGPSVETFKKLADTLIAIGKENSYFHYYDANNFGNHDYTSEDAFDANHLTPKGARKLASRVDSIINTYNLK